MKICRNCGRETRKLVHGRCNACRVFFRRNGRERTRADMIRSPKTPRPKCRNCKRRPADRSADLCGACYQYRNLNGFDRPSHLWREYCIACKRPRQGVNSPAFAKGRCAICYSYHYRYGRDRDVSGLYASGWCDCGNEAITHHHVQMHTSTGAALVDTIPLCYQCLRAEEAVG